MCVGVFVCVCEEACFSSGRRKHCHEVKYNSKESNHRIWESRPRGNTQFPWLCDAAVPLVAQAQNFLKHWKPASWLHSTSSREMGPSVRERTEASIQWPHSTQHWLNRPTPSSHLHLLFVVVMIPPLSPRPCTHLPQGWGTQYAVCSCIVRTEQLGSRLLKQAQTSTEVQSGEYLALLLRIWEHIAMRVFWAGSWEVDRSLPVRSMVG